MPNNSIFVLGLYFTFDHFLISISGYRHQAQQGSQGPQDQAEVPGYLPELARQGKIDIYSYL